MATQKNETIAQAVTKDHHEIWAFYDEYVKNVGDVEAQTRWANQLAWEIARHSIGEELVVYPMFEKHLGERGKEMADRDRQDHRAVKEKLSELEKIKPGSQDHANLLKVIIDLLKEHTITEERDDLPALENALTAQQNLDATKTFARTKKFAPTRAHPGAPDKPPFETVAGLLAAPLDKLRDVFSKFPTEEQLQAATEKAAGTIN